MPTARLNLRGLVSDDIEIEDRRGRVWLLDDGVPFGVALRLYKFAQGREDGSLTAADVDALSEGLTALFRARQPTVSREEIEMSFTLDELLEVAAFLSSRDRTTPAPDQEEPAPASKTLAAATPKKKTS